MEMEELLCNWTTNDDYRKIWLRFKEKQHIDYKRLQPNTIINSLKKAIEFEFENDLSIEAKNYLSTQLFKKTILDSAADRVDSSVNCTDVKAFLKTWLEECKTRLYRDSKWFDITNIVLGFITKSCNFYSMCKTSLRDPFKTMFSMLIDENLSTEHTIAVAGYLNACLNDSVTLPRQLNPKLQPYAIKIAQIITKCGDHIGQLTLSRLLFRLILDMHNQNKRHYVAKEVFSGANFQESVRSVVRRRMFDCSEGNQDCREFLNAINEVLGKVVSIQCCQAYICTLMVHTQESTQRKLWVDFNTDTQRITFAMPQRLLSEDTVSSTTCMDSDKETIIVNFSTVTAFYLKLLPNHVDLYVCLNELPILKAIKKSIRDTLKEEKNWELLFIIYDTSQIKMLYSNILMGFTEKYHGPNMKSIEEWLLSQLERNDGTKEALIPQCKGTPNQKNPVNSEFTMSEEDRGPCTQVKKASWNLGLQQVLQPLPLTRVSTDKDSLNSISTNGTELKKFRNVVNQHVRLNLEDSQHMNRLSQKSKFVNNKLEDIADELESHVSENEENLEEEQKSESESVSDESNDFRNIVNQHVRLNLEDSQHMKRLRRKSKFVNKLEDIADELESHVSENEEDLEEEQKSESESVSDESDDVIGETPEKEAIVVVNVAAPIVSRRKTDDTASIEVTKSEFEMRILSDGSNSKREAKRTKLMKNLTPLPDTTNNPEAMSAVKDDKIVITTKSPQGSTPNVRNDLKPNSIRSKTLANRRKSQVQDKEPEDKATSQEEHRDFLNRIVLIKPREQMSKLESVSEVSNEVIEETPEKKAVVAEMVARRIGTRRNTQDNRFNENLELECKASDSERSPNQTQIIERQTSTPPLPDTTNNPETMSAVNDDELVVTTKSPMRSTVLRKSPKILTPELANDPKPNAIRNRKLLNRRTSQMQDEVLEDKGTSQDKGVFDVFEKSPVRPANRKQRIRSTFRKQNSTSEYREIPHHERAVENVANAIAKKSVRKPAQSKIVPKLIMDSKTTPDPYDPYRKVDSIAVEEKAEEQRPESFTGKRFFSEGLKNGIPQGHGPKRSTTPAKKQGEKKKTIQSLAEKRPAGKTASPKRRGFYMPSDGGAYLASPDNSFDSGEFNPCHNRLIERVSIERGNKQAALNSIKSAKKSKPSESQQNCDSDSDFSPTVNISKQLGLIKERRMSRRSRPKIDYAELNDSMSSTKLSDVNKDASRDVSNRASPIDDSIRMPPPSVKAVQKSVQKDPERLDGKSKIIDPVSSICQPSCEEKDGLQSTCFDKTFESIDMPTVTAFTLMPQEINRIIYGTPERMREASALPVYKRRDSLLQTRSDSPVPLHPKDAEEPLAAELPMKAAVKKTTTNIKKMKKKPIPKGVNTKIFPSSDEEPYSYHMDVEVTGPKKAKVDYIYDDLSNILNKVRRNIPLDESPPRDPAVVTAGADKSRSSSPIIKTTCRKNYVSRDQSQLSTPKSDKAVLMESRTSTPIMGSTVNISLCSSQSSITPAQTIDREDQLDLNAADYYVANNQADRESKIANETYLEDDTVSDSSQKSLREEATEAVASQFFVNTSRRCRLDDDVATPKKKITNRPKVAFVNDRLGYRTPKPQKSPPPVKRSRSRPPSTERAAKGGAARGRRRVRAGGWVLSPRRRSPAARPAPRSAPPLRHRKPNDRKKINKRGKCQDRSHCCKNSVKNKPYRTLEKILHRLKFDRSKVAGFLQGLKQANNVTEFVMNSIELVINTICTSKEKDQILNGLIKRLKTAQVSDSDDSVEGECDGCSEIVSSESDSN